MIEQSLPIPLDQKIQWDTYQSIPQIQWDTYQFHVDCQNGNTERIKEFLKKHPSLINIPDKDGETGLHIACDFDKPEAVIELLSYNNINVNPQGRNYLTPLHFACSRESNKQIVTAFLKHPEINVNIKDEFAQIPLFFAPLHIANLIIASGKVKNIHTKNNLKQTFFYTQYLKNNTLDITDTQFINDTTDIDPSINIFTILNKHDFITKELYCAATMTSTTDSYKEQPIDAFIQLCIRLGANLNHRINGKRPLDNTEKEYKYGLKHLPYYPNPFKAKERIFHSFLRETPCISDMELYSILKNIVTSDIFKIIMGFYSALTIDKEIALLNNQKLKDEFYEAKSTITKKRIKQNLLAEKCKMFGYINLCSK